MSPQWENPGRESRPQRASVKSHWAHVWECSSLPAWLKRKEQAALYIHNLYYKITELPLCEWSTDEKILVMFFSTLVCGICGLSLHLSFFFLLFSVPNQDQVFKALMTYSQIQLF